MPDFTQKTKLDESAGTSLPVIPLTQTSPDQFPSFRAHPPHRPYKTTKEKAEHGDAFSSKKQSVAEYLQGMPPAPTNAKNDLMLRINP